MASLNESQATMWRFDKHLQKKNKRYRRRLKKKETDTVKFYKLYEDNKPCFFCREKSVKREGNVQISVELRRCEK